MEINKPSGWFKYGVLSYQTMDVGFGVSIKGCTVQNTAQISHCARDNNFTLLYFDFYLLLS